MKNKLEVHGGESKEKEDLLFTAQQSLTVSLKTSLVVFLAKNNNVKKGTLVIFMLLVDTRIFHPKFSNQMLSLPG